MTVQTENKAIYHWRDVTGEFVDAAGELQLGELLHDASWVILTEYQINITTI